MKLIGIGMIGESNYIGTSLSGSIQELKSKTKKPIQFLPKISDRKSHWDDHSKIKKLDINGFFERKKTIENLEAEMTGALLKTSNTDNSAVAGEANDDEYITSEYKDSNKI